MVSVVQMLISILDLVGVFLIGAIGALGISQISANSQNYTESNILQFLSKFVENPNSVLIWLSLMAISLLAIKTVLAMKITKLIIYNLSKKSAKISEKLMHRLIIQSGKDWNTVGTNEKIYVLTQGIDNILLGVVAVGVVMVSDLSLLLIVIVGIFVIDPVMAIFTITFFSTVAFILYKYLHTKTSDLGKKNAEMTVKSTNIIMEAFSTLREIHTKNRQDFYYKKFGETRDDLAINYATLSFLPYVTKYVIEISLLLGTLLVAFMQLVRLDPVQAFATSALFIAAGTRIAPAILRLQQGYSQYKTSWGKAHSTFELLAKINTRDHLENLTHSTLKIGKELEPKIQFDNVSFSYQTNDNFQFKQISFTIKPGEFVAILGPSGSGKSTLADLILGVLEPDHGTIKISNLSPKEAIDSWPGLISYLPQNLYIAEGTIKDNIALGYNVDYFSDTDYQDCLEFSNLAKFIENLPKGIDSRVGENGSLLSGGQKQRLGIARSLITRPRILLMDEATSALDVETEQIITESLNELKGQITLIAIAHRISTIRNADKIIYLEEGEIKALGTIGEVRSLVSNFDREARKAGF